jgi:hypothetical protein
MPASTGDRSALWLPLLRRFTELSPNWVVWKNVDSALSGVGDIDAAAPEDDWPAIERAFREWAVEHELGPVIVCRHIPGGLNLVAMPPTSSTLLEVGVKARRIWRGGTLFVLDDLKPLVMLDPRGFRRLRPGAEGLFKLLLNGARWDGGPDWDAMRVKHVATLLRTDPDGVRIAARRFGFAEGAALRGAMHAARGEWDRRSMLTVQAWALIQALQRPHVLASRVRFRFRAKATCPVVSTLLRDHRRIPADRASWLRTVALSHAVYDNGM